ncbi:MAG: hypothetical protein IIZ82_07210 [Clostridia bacterium]|nr:hypothetical protein [Clostridia bacterium]
MNTALLETVNRAKTLSIVGMCKNAGKTTVLNWLLRRSHGRVLGLTSIGRDGESVDVVTGTEKPGIFVPEGTLIATAKDMLALSDITQEIVYTTGIPTPLGEVVLVRARSAGSVQLAGPSITSQLRTVSDLFFSLGAEQAIIDGALGRKSLGARTVAESVILCTGASYDMRMEKVVRDTANIFRVMNLKKAATVPEPSDLPLADVLKETGEALVPGALSDSAVLPLLKSGVLKNVRLVVKDPSKVLLSPDTLDKLAIRNVSLETVEAANVLCVTVNPVSAYGWKFDPDAFRRAVQAAVNVPVINVKEAQHDLDRL